MLTEHRRRPEAERAPAGALWVGGDHVFRRELGEPLFPDTPTALMAKLERQHHAAATIFEQLINGTASETSSET